MVKNKKGFLLGEYTLKIIIAVLSLLLLFYLLFSLYSNSKNERNFQLAEASLDELSDKMSEAGESGNAQTILLNPNKWVLLNYKKEDAKKPGFCEDNCICLCPELGFFDVGKRLSGCNQECMCEEFGTCRNFDENIDLKSIELPDDITIKFQDNKFTISEK